MSNAAHDIAAWALELAARDVADWPEGERRVRNARKFVLAYVRGKEPRSFPTEDIEFTARLLARIFDDELRIGVANIIQILDDLGLPTDEVPLERRRPVGASIRSASMPVEPVIPLRPFSSYAAPALASQRGCDECNPLCPRFRNAA
jgi:hypothetical protein